MEIKMQNMTFLGMATSSGKFAHLLRNTLGAFALGFLISSAPAMAEDKVDDNSMHDMHGMHDMHDMHDMQGMGDMHDMHGMDHSQHMKSMSQKGAYTRSVESYTVPDVKLVDVNGKPVALRELMDGHSALMVNFIFTTCTTICPVMTSTFQQVQEKLGKERNEVRMVSISIDPENDTPRKMKEYAAKHKAGGQWLFLTGTLENSILVQKALGVFAGEKMNHKPVTLMKAKGSATQWVRLEGLADAGQVVDEFRKLDMEGMKHE
jgi:protein SCO1/2